MSDCLWDPGSRVASCALSLLSQGQSQAAGSILQHGLQRDPGNGQMDGQMEGGIDGCVHAYTHNGMDGWVDIWIVGRINVVDSCMDGLH